MITINLDVINKTHTGQLKFIEIVQFLFFRLRRMNGNHLNFSKGTILHGIILVFRIKLDISPKGMIRSKIKLSYFDHF